MKESEAKANIITYVTAEAENLPIQMGKVFDVAIQALEKQTPKKIAEIHIDEYICPSCGEENSGCDDRKITDKYCPNCGQRLEV